MTLLYLLDTNTISEPIKPEPNKKVVSLIDDNYDKIAISSFVVYELIKGVYQLSPSRKRQRIFDYIEDVLSTLPILTYTQEAAIWQGKETARLKNNGKIPPFLDAQIASVAKVNNLILVTRNITDFQYFADLKLENWFD
jgi:tRNA(fMet)-specific endonuclease VapC